MSNIVIKFCARNVFDVFAEHGWNTWARFQVSAANGKRHLRKLGGGELPPSAINEIKERFLK